VNWQLLNLAAPDYEQRPEPPFLCGLLYRGRRHLVSGSPEANKTLFALILGLELIRSGETFALIDFESGPQATRLMLTELGATTEELERVLYTEADGPPDIDDILELVDAGAALAIIDAAIGAYDASELDDNARVDAEKFGRAWIDPLWRAGIATLVIDHVVKNTEARGKFAIGSERKAGRTDVHFGLEAKLQLTRGTNGLVRVTTHKDRPGWFRRPYAAEIELQSNPDTHAITWSFREGGTLEGGGGHWRPTELMERVSAYLASQPEPVSRNTVEKAIKGTATYVRQAMTELVDSGHAREIPAPRGGRLLAHVSLFDSTTTASDCVGTASATQSNLHATASTASASYKPTQTQSQNGQIDGLDYLARTDAVT
jgi:hypothetical protein